MGRVIQFRRSERRKRELDALDLVTAKRKVKKAKPKKATVRKIQLIPVQRRQALGLRGGSPLTSATPRRGLQSDPFLG